MPGFSMLTGADLAPVSIGKLSIEQLCFSNGGLQQGQQVYTMLHHSQKVAAGLMISSSPQQHALTGLLAFPRLVTISTQNEKEEDEEEEEEEALQGVSQTSKCKASVREVTATLVSSCSECTVSRAGTRCMHKSQEPRAAHTLAGNAGSCLLCACHLQC